jgi:hypothetical protein
MLKPTRKISMTGGGQFGAFWGGQFAPLQTQNNPSQGVVNLTR